MSDMESIGTFRVESGKLAVTDPCYDRDTWGFEPGQKRYLGGILEKVRNGEWEAFITTEDGRVSNLVIVNEVCTTVEDEQDIYEPADFEVGVDSGQAGFFDESVYPVGDREKGGEYNKDEFYDECCHSTCDSGEHGGIIRERGCVSSSGYGDGGYTVFVKENGLGEVVAARIEFIAPEEDYYEDDDEDLEDEDEADDLDE